MSRRVSKQELDGRDRVLRESSSLMRSFASASDMTQDWQARKWMSTDEVGSISSDEAVLTSNRDERWHLAFTFLCQQDVERYSWLHQGSLERVCAIVDSE